MSHISGIPNFTAMQDDNSHFAWHDSLFGLLSFQLGFLTYLRQIWCMSRTEIDLIYKFQPSIIQVHTFLVSPSSSQSKLCFKAANACRLKCFCKRHWMHAALVKQLWHVDAHVVLPYSAISWVCLFDDYLLWEIHGLNILLIFEMTKQTIDSGWFNFPTSFIKCSTACAQF